MRSTVPLPDRSCSVGAANALLPALWAMGALRRPVFEVDALLARACELTGLDDFGDDWFLEPLQVLAHALAYEANLNAVGRLGAYGQLVKLLRDRLWTQQWLREHPEIAETPLAPPLVVVGAMRSGTTRLHRLLAADRRFAHLRFFETISPVPPTDFARGGRDPRPIEARRIFAAVRTANRRTSVIHPTGLFAPEEELGLLVASVWGMKHETQWHVPSYSRWSDRQNPVPAYRHLARLLRLVGWLRGEDGSRPWVLKTPQHMLDLAALLEVFPDARLIFIHRDPARVVGSTCSLCWNQMIIHSDTVDPQTIGRTWLGKTERQVERMLSARERVAPERMIDVRYEDMDADWGAVMNRIYDFLGHDIAPAMPAMRDYIDGADTMRHKRPHRYSLAQYGLEADAVRERFGDYIDAFDLGRQTVTEFKPRYGRGVGKAAPAERLRATRR